MDVALMNYGTLESAMQLMLANGISITEDIAAGDTLAVPKTIEVDTPSLQYLQQNEVEIGTKG
jgi:hypothetical protein